MSDVDGAAPAAAEPTPAPEETPVDLPKPVQSEPDQATVDAANVAKEKADKAAADAKKPISTRDALKKATEKVEADEKAKAASEKDKALADKTKPAAKPEPKAEPQARAEDGKFAPKAPETPAEGQERPQARPAQTTAIEPPARFSADAKAAWNDAPEPVRAEVHRAVKELEQGYQKYRGDAEAFAEVKAFADLAKNSGTTLKAAMSNYVGIEQKLRTDLVGGIETILQNRGVSLRDFAATIMGQAPEAQASRQDATINELRRELSGLKQQLGGVTQGIQQQRSDAIMSTVAAFADQPGHERFEELATDIKFFLDSKRAGDLAEAYQLAERLNPAQGRTYSPASAPATDQTAQNRNGQKSITGAPGRGSTPAEAPSPTIREALKRAMARAG